MKDRKTEKTDKDLRADLPRGAIINLAAKYACTHTWIRRVLSGEQAGDPGIISDAKKLNKLEVKHRAACNQIYQPRAS